MKRYLHVFSYCLFTLLFIGTLVLKAQPPNTNNKLGRLEFLISNSDFPERLIPDNLILKSLSGDCIEYTFNTKEIDIEHSGHVLIELPLGKYAFAFSKKGYYDFDFEKEIKSTGLEQMIVNLDPREPDPYVKEYLDQNTLEVRQKKTNENISGVIGRIIDAKDGLPVANVKVFATSNERFYTYTDKNGWYSLEVDGDEIDLFLYDKLRDVEIKGFQLSYQHPHTNKVITVTKPFNPGLESYGNLIFPDSVATNKLEKSLIPLNYSKKDCAIPDSRISSCVPPTNITVGFASVSATPCVAPECHTITFIDIDGNPKTQKRCRSCNLPNVVNIYPPCESSQSAVLSFRSYLKYVAPSEWIPQWLTTQGGEESFRAGIVAISTTANYFINHPTGGSSYDVSTSTCDQAFGDQQPMINALVDEMIDWKLFDENGSIPKAEFAAENNDNPNRPSGCNYPYWGQCGNGYFQKSYYGPTCRPHGGCYPNNQTIDYVSLGKFDIRSHPRGMSQRGSMRWASGYDVKSNNDIDIDRPPLLPKVYSGVQYCKQDWPGILAHYYPYYSLINCTTGQSIDLSNGYANDSRCPTTCNWTRKASIPGEGRRMSESFSINGKGYVKGGEMLLDQFSPKYPDDFYQYDPIRDEWERMGNFLSADGGPRASGVSFVINNKAYIVTGYYSTGILLNDVREFDPSRIIKWKRKNDLPSNFPLRYSAASFVINGKGYICCGSDLNGNVYKDLWEYDPVNDSWTRKADFPSRRWNAFGFSATGKGYVGCGFNSSLPGGTDPTGALKDFYEYNPSTNSWRRITDYPITGVSGIAFSTEKVGYCGFGDKNFYAYNPSANSWTRIQTNNEPSPRNRVFGFSINNDLYLAGGYYSPNDTKIVHMRQKSFAHCLCKTKKHLEFLI